WHKTYGNEWAEHGTNAIQTPDSGYLLGGYFWKPGIGHSLDAMVIKTDSLGNEEWTKYYGNPDVDDDMAFVALADDSSYLIATIFGEAILTPEARTGKYTIIKIDLEGNPYWIKKYNPERAVMKIKNITSFNNMIIATGYSYYDTPNLYNWAGWLYKLDSNYDSIWMHEYQYFTGTNDENFLYDFSPTTDNGFVVIGKANEIFTDANMWVLKLDSMGCDTPGCITTVIPETSPFGGDWGEVKAYPNPASECITFEFENTEYLTPPSVCSQYGKPQQLVIYNVFGEKVHEEMVYQHHGESKVNIQNWKAGIYVALIYSTGQVLGQTKFIVQ
ncbi:MAG: T9SS type A sorting domain-containing protein, partial [Bacteroidales bacterium]|nr:T9SS type A sorting domain-containing protein [Bacteroidales bacterium]